jgi:dihydroflavonol-4-reductase
VRATLTRGLDAVIMNPASIIGRGDVSGWARLIRMAVAGKLPGVPPGALSFCHGGEVARAHINAVEHGRSGENYLLGGTDASFLELVRTIGEVTGHRVPSRVTPAPVLRAMGHLSEWASHLTGKPPALTPESAYLVTRHFFCDSGKAVRELDYCPRALRSMVEESYRWLRQEALLTL